MTVGRILRQVTLVCLGVAVITATAAEPSLKEIMQELRDNLVQITDGLLTDDFDRVAQGAAGIAHHPPIPATQVQLIADELGPEMAAFKQFDETVHQLSLSITAAAEKRDRDRAIADYRRMLDGCLACHAAYKDRITIVLGGTL